MSDQYTHNIGYLNSVYILRRSTFKLLAKAAHNTAPAEKTQQTTPDFRQMEAIDLFLARREMVMTAAVNPTLSVSRNAWNKVGLFLNITTGIGLPPMSSYRTAKRASATSIPDTNMISSGGKSDPE